MEHIESIPAAPRTELMELFGRLSAKRIIYIHAPAGYGKSFSARLWLELTGGASAWVAVNEPAGRKPVDFCERLAEALMVLQPDNSALKEITAHKSFATAPFEFIEHALKAFSSFAQDKAAQKYTLVMDDLHLVSNVDTLKRLPELILDLSRSVTVFMLSRAEPFDSLSELVIKDKMAIVGAERFRFSESEIKSFFASCGQRLTVQQTRDVMEMTNGWAIGLNALLLSGNQQMNRSLIFRHLEIFVKEQVWEKWDKKRRDFMLRVSVTDEITPGFCDAMTGRTDSRDILDALVRENAFISVGNEGIYRFHHLFLDFLRHMLDRENDELRHELNRRAGDWFFDLKNCYKAVEHYMKCGDKNGITKSLRLVYDYNTPYASVEDTLAIIRMSVDGSIVDEYPFLLEVQTWAAFVEGRGSDLEGYIDRYFERLPQIILQNPASAQQAVMSRFIDYRVSMADLANGMKKLTPNFFVQAKTPSITLSMPFFHRSYRDYSEYAEDTEKSVSALREALGNLIWKEYGVIDELIRAGMAYEKGNLDAAHKFALSAHVMLKYDFAPEIKFCSFMTLTAILDAEGQHAEAQKVLEGAEAMIEYHKAYYLNANFRAFSCRMKLCEGDLDAARNWLKNDAVSPYDALSFYKLYQHFTTARAHIVTGDYNTAILFLKKLLVLCKQYRRPLDVIEINILLAISYWKKARGSQIEALEQLEKAVMVAQEYGFIQVFANEGAGLSNMLHRLQKRVVQKDYAGSISSSQVKTLYISTLSRAKRSMGLTGGRALEELKFTEQQKRVMRYLCDGLTHKEIAEGMNLKPSAIKSHMILIYKKLDVSNGVDAMIKIKESGVLDEGE